MPMRLKARIRDDGEVDLDLRAFRITKATWFIRERWQAGRNDVAEFVLSGTTTDGLQFKSDSLSFNSLGERWSGVHNRHWSKPRGDLGKVQYFGTLQIARERPVLKLHLKGFDCFPALHAKCALGAIQVAGETTLGEPDRLTGWITIEASEPPSDVGAWRAEAEKLAEHLRRILSVGAATMLQAPVLEFAAAETHEIEVLSQSRQHAPVMRVFHKLALQPALDAAIASFFNPPVEAKNLFFAIEWFAMATTYNEMRLVNAMTALENLIDSNLTEEEGLIEPKREFDKTRKIIRKVVRACVDQWSPDRADGMDHVVIAGDLNDTPDSAPLAPLLANGSDLQDISAHPSFNDGGRPGTFANGTKGNKIDYILMSPALFAKVTAGGIDRRGVWGGKHGTLWPIFPEMTSAHQAASDHAAIWADVSP